MTAEALLSRNVPCADVKLSEDGPGLCWWSKNYANTKSKGQSADLAKFSIYLQEEHDVSDAYYFLGAADDDNQQLYELIYRSGFVLVFSEHYRLMLGMKKGNVDDVIVFAVIERIAQNRIAERMFRYLTTATTKEIVCWAESRSALGVEWRRVSSKSSSLSTLRHSVLSAAHYRGVSRSC